MLKFFIDSISNVIEGWVFFDGKEITDEFSISIEIDQKFYSSISSLYPREDVYAIFNVLNCGFSFDISAKFPLVNALVQINLELKGEKYSLFEGRLNRAAVDKYIIGDFGFRFLHNDTNMTRDFLTRKTNLSDEAVRSLVNTFIAMQKKFEERNVRYYSLIIPEKNEVLKCFDPTIGPLSNERLIHKLSHLMIGYNFVFLLEWIKKHPEVLSFYPKTDTHIADFYIDELASFVASLINLEFIRNEFSDVTFIGDLVNINEACVHAELIKRIKIPDYLEISDQTEYLLQNNLGVTDSVIKFENNLNKNLPSLYIFGNSTARKFFYTFMKSFSRGFFRWGTKLNLKDIDEGNYDVVLCILPERYLESMAGV